MLNKISDDIYKKLEKVGGIINLHREINALEIIEQMPMIINNTYLFDLTYCCSDKGYVCRYYIPVQNSDKILDIIGNTTLLYCNDKNINDAVAKLYILLKAYNG